MKHAIGIPAVLLAALAVVATPSSASANPDRPPCRYAPNITVMQDEWANVSLGDTFQQVRDAVGGAGFAIDDDPWNWRRAYHTCDRHGSVEVWFSRIPGRGLILQGSSIKWV